MKTKIIVPIHSLIDVITNSSTELFIIDKEKGLDAVQEVVNEALKKYPNDYPSYGEPLVHLGDPTWYLNYYLNDSDIDDIIKQLEYRGYEITAPEKIVEPEAIIISWERGSCNKGFINFIKEKFNAELIDY